MFEINKLNLKQKNFYLEMKNFYKNPNEVCNFLNKKRPYVHKWYEKNSLNTIDFLECRHEFLSKDFKKTEKKLYDYLNIDTKNIKGLVITNFIKFLNNKNKFKDHYWWPHIDNGLYNCIVYLNKEPCDGTNIYAQIVENDGPEHSHPWQSKSKYGLLQNIKAEYNQLVIFRSNLYHGMAYNNKKFNNRFRKNQVIFI
jgi:hypothetical protein